MFLELVALYQTFLKSEALAAAAAYISGILVILLLAWLIKFILKKYILRVINSLFEVSRSALGVLLIKHKVFQALSHLGPAVFIYLASSLLTTRTFVWTEEAHLVIHNAIEIYIILIITLSSCALVGVVYDYLKNSHYLKNRAIKGYIQVIQIILWAFAGTLIISRVFNISPWAFVTSLGALSAVLILVFKDTILGFVTNIQVAANDMVRVGDWITIADMSIDGTVTDVSINTVKIENFDKTISTIPTYSLVNHNVQNWRGMVEAGGRRIKRALLIDMDTIKFCDEHLLKKLSAVHCLQHYLKTTLDEIAVYNQKFPYADNIILNRRCLSNIGVFRKYIEHYLQGHPHVHQDLTLIIRQLAPTEKGLPLELYIFTNDTNWVNYERIQSDIFDHLIAALPAFELKAFQVATGRLG